MTLHLIQLIERIRARRVRQGELRWCMRLANLDLAQFEEAISKLVPDAEQSETLAARPAEKTGTACPDLQLAAVITRLPLQQRRLLYLFKAGASYHQIGAALRVSDDGVLRELARLLNQLATHTLPATEAASARQ